MSPYTSPSTANALASKITYTTSWLSSPAVVVPSRTDNVPIYKPHNRAALDIMMMKPTKMERARMRRSAVAKA